MSLAFFFVVIGFINPNGPRRLEILHHHLRRPAVNSASTLVDGKEYFNAPSYRKAKRRF
ncbi:MAG: hypothetical protein JXM70_07375 [Pirellulales bacterium]|nr:hypothetical protein [Pirellulales bacterium]